MGLKYSQVKEIYKRADWLFYNNLYDERNLARDMIEAAQQWNENQIFSFST